MSGRIIFGSCRPPARPHVLGKTVPLRNAKEEAMTENAKVKGGVVPHVSVGDASAAVEFYKKAFGATEAQRVPAEDGKRLLHCHLYINDGSFMLNDCFPEFGHGLKTPQAF